jgi:CDP-diacylglycerol--glycerol-3-phosphate 3-phosphatidyltransferase
VTAAFVSDVFDGIVARRVGVATERLRRADTIVDTAFYVCAAAALLLHAPSVLGAHAVGVASLVALELSRWVVERIRYGRLASYHMWSAKAWGVALWLGFSEAFVTGQPGPFIQAAVATGLLADVEGLAASLVLSTWQHDVPTVWHALRLERAWRSRHESKE